MHNILYNIYLIIQSKSVFFVTLIFFICAKLYLLALIVPKTKHATAQRFPLILLLGVLVGSLIGDLSWFIKILRNVFAPWIPYAFNIFSLRIAWAFLILKYQSLGLFIESVPNREFTFKLIHYISIAVSLLIGLYFLYLAFFEISLTNQIERAQAFLQLNPPLEIKAMNYIGWYLIPIVGISSLFHTIKNVATQKLPKLLKRQMIILVQYLLTPFFISEAIVANVPSDYEISALVISGILLTCSIYYSITTILNLRFLNLDEHIPARQRLNFIQHFKEALETLSKVGNIEELIQITQTFFKEAFDIQNKKVSLYIKNISTDSNNFTASDKTSQLENSIEQFLQTLSQRESDCLKKLKVLIHDELSFTEFYNPSPIQLKFIQFLQNNDLDIFLPIYRNNNIVAYISVGLNARPQHNYTEADHNEMLVYSNYLASVINLIQNRNLKQLIQKKHILQDNVFLKHQEINLYKESIEAFLKTNTKHIGVCFYKNQKISIANTPSEEIINGRIIQQDRHPLTKAIKEIGHQVEQFKVPATQLINYDGIRIVLTAVSNLERQNVIVTLYQPEISDVLKHKINILKDPERWNFLLYLETTKLGAKINQLIPSDSESMLNLKIDLLQNAITRKIVFLSAPDEDIQALAHVMCQPHMNNMLHIFTLKNQSKDSSHYKRIFGDHSALNLHTEPALFEKATSNATLLIENIQFLDSQSQAMLANYSKTGLYSSYNSNSFIESNIRIICTSSQAVSNLILENNCDYALYEALKDSTIMFPSLLTLAQEEIEQLAQGYLNQFLQQPELRFAIPPTNKEIYSIIRTRPTSLSELKRKVKNLLVSQKEDSTNSDLDNQNTEWSNEHELIHATRLGKKALQNPDIMKALWEKFKNQNKIATFLGVNRSSVNRRCKEYQLQ